MTTTSEIFTDIYARRVWGDGSGGGSNPEAVPEYIALVERLLGELKPSRVLDIGCGYGWIAQRITWGDAPYIGIDCVAEAVKHARRIIPGLILWGDALQFSLPSAGLILVKEVTQHLDNRSVHTLLQQLERFPAVLHCSAVTSEMNGEISTGETRGVDIAKPPFSRSCKTVLEYCVGETSYLCQLWYPHE